MCRRHYYIFSLIISTLFFFTNSISSCIILLLVRITKPLFRFVLCMWNIFPLRSLFIPWTVLLFMNVSCRHATTLAFPTNSCLLAEVCPWLLAYEGRFSTALVCVEPLWWSPCRLYFRLPYTCQQCRAARAVTSVLSQLQTPVHTAGCQCLPCCR